MSFLTALAPVVLIVGLGRFLAWRNVLTPDGWRAVERLCYLLLFPVMVVTVLASASFDTAPWKVAAACIGAQLVLTATGLLSRWWPGTLRPAIGSIIQSNARWNTMIGLSIAGALYGEAGVALVAIVAAALIPSANFISVSALSHFGDPPEGLRRNPLAEMARNPILIACALGGLLNVANLPPSGVIGYTMDILGRSAVAIGLLAAGAGVDLAALQRAGLRTFFWSAVRLCGFPIVAGFIAIALGVTQLELAVIVICAATPTASMGYILARQLGGDAPLMANLIAVQTVLAALTMPAMFFLLTGL
ncbi:AEC family transporter [bacterium]|nr:AEC family transporter [bacterium]